jgi:hypothetical protein
MDLTVALPETTITASDSSVVSRAIAGASDDENLVMELMEADLEALRERAKPR